MLLTDGMKDANATDAHNDNEDPFQTLAAPTARVVSKLKSTPILKKAPTTAQQNSRPNRGR